MPSAMPGLAGEEMAVRFAAAALAGVRSRPARAARVHLAGSCRRTAPRLDAVGRAKRVLAERLDSLPTLWAVARAAHVSPFHLTREFRARTGLTLHQYTMALKTRHALLEIERYAGCLERLAIDLGYAGLPHLSRQFKAAFGVGPREWLRGRRIGNCASSRN
jgi:AraC-like DNA-binding protein